MAFTYDAKGVHDAGLSCVLDLDQFVAILVIQAINVGSYFDRR